MIADARAESAVFMGPGVRRDDWSGSAEAGADKRDA
jgi:hypothetical protein